MVYMLGFLIFLVIVIVGALLYLRRRGSTEGDDGDGDDGLRGVIDRELARLSAEQGYARLLVGVDGSVGLALQPDLQRLLVVAPTDPAQASPAPGQPVSLWVRTYGLDALVGVDLRETDMIRVEKDDTELRARSVDLYVFLDDPERPAHVVSLLDGSARRSSKRYREARASGATWEGLLKLAARRATGVRAAAPGSVQPAARAPERTPAPERAPVSVRAPERTPAPERAPVSVRPPERTPIPDRAPRPAARTPAVTPEPGAPPPLPKLEPRVSARVVEASPVELDPVKREAARLRAQQLLERSRGQG